MGYTSIAGMPIVTGLYTLILPAIAFAPLGSSKLLVARTRVLLAENVASWELPADPTAAGRARELTTATLAERGARRAGLHRRTGRQRVGH
jgi:hypothetical protein